MAKLSQRKQRTEIIVRAVVVALQVLAIVSGILLLALIADDVRNKSTTQQDNHNDINSVAGKVTVSAGSLILIYEIVMIIFAATNLECVNHSARLTVDIILNMFFTVLLILATLVASLIALYRLIFNPQGMRHVVVATFALPIGVGTSFSVAFIVSAVVFGNIHSRLNRAAAVQPTQVVVAVNVPPTVVMEAQQPAGVDNPITHAPDYNQTSFSAVPPNNLGQNQAIVTQY